MHLLPCPQCETAIAVSPSQAGDRTTCPNCQSDVVIPKLGDLRRLPSVEDDVPAEAAAERETSMFGQTLVVALGLLASACLLIAGYCGIRWSLVEVPLTTEAHISSLREQYADAEAALLIREYEDMEKFNLDLAAPYKYKQLELEKRKWGQNASIAAGVGGLAVLGALVVAGLGRGKPG